MPVFKLTRTFPATSNREPSVSFHPTAARARAMGAAFISDNNPEISRDGVAAVLGQWPVGEPREINGYRAVVAILTSPEVLAELNNYAGRERFARRER